jgi:hypothetical protein
MVKLCTVQNNLHFDKINIQVKMEIVVRI